MSDELDIDDRANRIENETTLEARSVLLGHALGLYPLRSPTKEYLAEMTVRCGDEYPEDDREKLSTGLKAVRLKEMAAEAIGREEPVGSSLGPVVAESIAALEAAEEASIREIAEERTNDAEAFEESTYKTFDVFER